MSQSSSVRRAARQRREYLYRKSIESQQSSTLDSKRKLIEASESGKSIPTEIRNDYDALKKTVDAEDVATEHGVKTIDDEYATLGLYDPRVCVTTSREPSSRLKQFSKEINLIVPNAQRINRGGYRVDELVNAAKEADFTDIIVLQETRGEPDGLVISHLPLGPTAFFSLSGTVLRHDIEGVGSMSEVYPHVLLDGFASKLGERIGNVLKAIFPVPKPDSKRVITFHNDNDFISMRHHMYAKSGMDKVALSEVGPRFEMRLYQLRLGTLEMKEAEMEYVLRPYQNTGKKRKVL
ncbi:hypothetical protein TrLO_g13988 [Triparma laevis f. longispina]|uniref:Brix domain-containing protein n=2 Tax=Triparma laevis TaxID=1534972 RepID=A0A9W7CCS7_9STRA|nr:hypothetical protein TrLO_g13988 [Triparma laevis f. longispina]